VILNDRDFFDHAGKVGVRALARAAGVPSAAEGRCEDRGAEGAAVRLAVAMIVMKVGDRRA
jgi:hypothetical protein